MSSREDVIGPRFADNPNLRSTGWHDASRKIRAPLRCVSINFRPFLLLYISIHVNCRSAVSTHYIFSSLVLFSSFSNVVVEQSL